MTEDQKKTLEMLLPSYSTDPELIVPRGKLPEQLHTEIESSEEVKFLLAGQRGMGKTTELKRLVNLLSNTEILPIFVQFGAQADITHPLLINAMADSLISNMEEKTSKEFNKMYKIFQDWFVEEDKLIVDLEGSEGSASIGGKIPIAKGKAGLHFKSNKTNTKKLKINKAIEDLIDHFNQLIIKARKETSKRIAFIVDDIDKIQDIPSIEKTFIQSSHLINGIKCPCIFTVPITYATSSSLRIAALPYSNIYRVPAIEILDENGKRNEKAFDFMKRIFTLRMPFNPIPSEILDTIISYSGGIIVDAMRMIRNLCKERILTPNIQIDEKLAEEEFQKLIDDYKFVFDSPTLWEKLSEICKSKDKKIIMTDDMLPDLLYKIIVIEYREKNLWFDLHPAARRLYEQNSKVIDESIKHN